MEKLPQVTDETFATDMTGMAGYGLLGCGLVCSAGCEVGVKSNNVVGQCWHNLDCSHH